MKIYAINSINNKQNNLRKIQHNTTNPQQVAQKSNYNPLYYRDFNLNISFGGRLPEDFYSQNFNRENMPITMKNYLDTNYAERSKLPPIQIMQESFDGLNSKTINSANDIKDLFPNEPKFAKLRPANYQNATVGIMKKIKDIKNLQDTPEPLFKDGCDDLTTYLVRKIYLEGKTVKEIDKDFAKDINPIYELAARIPTEKAKKLGKNESAYFSHSTIYNLGIRFPEVPFWNSFIATRDDYERVRRVKNATGQFVNADSPEGREILRRRQTQQTPEKPRKYNFKRDNIKNATDSILNSRDNTQKAFKEAKRHNRNIEELTFLQKYWSQIMSVAAEKVHLSEELIDFNAQRKQEEQKLQSAVLDKLIEGSDLTKREKTPLQIFWNERTDLKGHFSNAIVDTTIMFTDYFGADGENPEFKALLKYAEEIKPNREIAKLEHARIQAEYDEMAKSLQVLNENSQDKAKIERVQKIIEEKKAQEFRYNIDGVDIVTEFDIKAHAMQMFDNDFIMLPARYKSVYMRELDKIIADNPERFYLSCCFEHDPATPNINKVIYSDETLREYDRQMLEIMDYEHNKEIQAARFVLMDYADEKGLANRAMQVVFANDDILYTRDKIIEKLIKTGEVEQAEKAINQAYNNIMTPLTNKEKIQLRHKLFQFIREYKPSDTMSPQTSVPAFLQLLSDAVNNSKTYQNQMKEVLNNDSIYEYEGPFLRYLLKSDAKPFLKTTIAEHALRCAIYHSPETTALMATSNTEKFRKLMSYFPNEMKRIADIASNALTKTMFKII